jgi:hypothetical protein
VVVRDPIGSAAQPVLRVVERWVYCSSHARRALSETAIVALQTAAASPKQPRRRRGAKGRNGAVRARCLAWLLHGRADSHAWRDDRRRCSVQQSRSSKSAATSWPGSAGRRWCCGTRRSVPGDLSGPLHRRLTASARPPVGQLRLMPKRSGAAEGVGDGRRPTPVEVDHSRRRGPFSGL